eukprot:NODE_2848_length_2132_cov_7.175561.p1 GENE.NODE_2848_length_2132_cov_7.175561~~NODE_2848_length_2132_cov_7.175561.p1  ORF type:complete len:302 (-),score=95.20 NODE_2848_length_2132_cov_7.175561:753-1658(-)
MRHDVEEETGRRNATLERCERKIGELKGTLSVDIAQGVYEKVEADLCDRWKGVEDIPERMKSLAEAVLTESRARNAGQEEAMQVTVQSKLALEREVTERRTQLEESSRKLQELVVACEQEKADRAAGETCVRGQLTSLREQLATEAGERINEGTHVKRSVQRTQAQLQEMELELRALVDVESGRRAAGDERIERQCGEVRASIVQEESSRIDAIREMERTIRTVRLSHEHTVVATASTASVSTSSTPVKSDVNHGQVRRMQMSEMDGNLTSRVDAALSSRLGRTNLSSLRTDLATPLGQAA